MESIVDTVVLVAISVVGAALARRLGFVAPLVLLVAGLGLSYVPGFPDAHLEPELVLIGILPPLLYVAALQTSVPAFRLALRPILLLAVGLVVVTALVVGFLVHLLLPAVPLAACVALGAIVAPPDAVSATAIARRVGLPRPVVTILEGESLLNDATALVMVRVSVGALMGTAIGFWEITAAVSRAAGGGLLIGLAFAVAAAWLHRKVEDALLDDAVALLTPFVVVIVAERLHTSSVVAVVVAGLYLGHRIPYLLSPTSRLQMDAVWRLIVFLLEGVVFLLVGLQLRDVLSAIETDTATTVKVTAVVFGALLVIRFLWIYPATYLARLIPRIRNREDRPPATVPTVIAWAGMRGVVTLAAAQTLPEPGVDDVPVYPRELFVFVAFAIIVLTLLVQGTTLPWLARRLGVREDSSAEDALAEAGVQHAAGRAALEALEEHADGAPESVVERLRGLVENRGNNAWERLGSQERETPSAAYGRLRREMISAERHVFKTARNEGRIPEEVLVRAQRELDLEESQLQRSDD
ncbi:CPA1 family monovalent cation:H+ antiporter [Actinoplanes campanulatus]|uniref:CPA1 family monovalent cation:H+ antiporter n=1 Tax=Actinoplanes campanulatus TaxID=113559 RepID=A0A7W5AA65_9ACTN|nr:Na+/H+ antiporter [Actinoplanes campanulatus]MBB3092536.1 CPA1 family monovalent cation:H+ antiporter [Actinoplanes campanulatus]GGM97259.1 Na+/H+ antiporter [Actinoplanes campanulatus]GID34369.1 Na+/H+ antiporter [Actinoplanes campanulatus]